MLAVNLTDTIAAVATSAGNGGIGIIRVSGESAFQICDKLFKAKNGMSIQQMHSHTIHYGTIEYNNAVIDEVLLTVMKAPSTYTREDVVEINTHGGYRAVNAVLEAVIKSGARLAEPGEFTKRAFLNGRIDLTKAEAVRDIISAKTRTAMEIAVNKLQGKLEKRIKALRDDLLTLIANIEVSIDYPEHEEEEQNRINVSKTVEECLSEINTLIKTSDTGKIYSEGIKTAIVGRPNVGKSSLLNALLNEDRAIVTDIPGTTRDVLTELISIDGIPLIIADTAGIRESNDAVEKIGVEKSISEINSAQLVITVFDGSRSLTEEDKQLLDLTKNKNRIIVVNKDDLGICEEYKNLDAPVFISAKSGKGMDNLYKRVKDIFITENIDTSSDVLISNQRNVASLQEAKNSLENVLNTINTGMPEDLLTIDLTRAYEYLGQVTGETLEDDIIDRLFSEFCLGK